MQVSSDRFVHYESGAIGTFKGNAVMSLDDFAQGRIEYYGLQASEQLTFDGITYQLGEGNQQIVF